MLGRRTRSLINSSAIVAVRFLTGPESALDDPAVQLRLTPFEPAQALDKNPDIPPLIGRSIADNMRCDRHLGHTPHRRNLWQGFGSEYIKCGASDPASLKRSD